MKTKPNCDCYFEDRRHTIRRRENTNSPDRYRRPNKRRSREEEYEAAHKYRNRGWINKKIHTDWCETDLFCKECGTKAIIMEVSE